MSASFAMTGNSTTFAAIYSATQQNGRRTSTTQPLPLERRPGVVDPVAVVEPDLDAAIDAVVADGWPGFGETGGAAGQEERVDLAAEVALDVVHECPALLGVL